MSNKKQTAVEWLMSEVWVRLNMDLEWREKVYEQAKAMEKEQTIKAYDEGKVQGFHMSLGDGKQYYEETYE